MAYRCLSAPVYLCLINTSVSMTDCELCVLVHIYCVRVLCVCADKLM